MRFGRPRGNCSPDPGPAENNVGSTSWISLLKRQILRFACDPCIKGVQNRLAEPRIVSVKVVSAGGMKNLHAGQRLLNARSFVSLVLSEDAKHALRRQCLHGLRHEVVAGLDTQPPGD